jgi:hypothetical protein
MPHGLIVEVGAFLADCIQNGQHRFMLAICQSGRGPDAHAFAQQFYDLNNFAIVQPQMPKWLIFRKGLSTPSTEVTLNPAIFIFEPAMFYGRTRTASTFQLAFPSKEN